MIVFSPPQAPAAAPAAPMRVHARQRAALLAAPSMPFPAPVGKAVVRLDAMTDIAFGPGFSVGGDMGLSSGMIDDTASLADLREDAGAALDTVAPSDSTIDNLPPALRMRYDECINAGGVFDPSKNRCCSVDSYDGSVSCSVDPLERIEWEKRAERSQAVTMLAGAAVVGALIVGTGLYFGLRRIS